MPCPSICSWSFRKLLGLRSLVRDKFRFVVGNGSRISLWYDRWHPVGRLIEVFGERMIYDSGLGRNAMVADIIREGTWRWPLFLSVDWMDLIELTPLSFLPNVENEDRLVWDDDVHGLFSVRRAWDVFRVKRSKVMWYKSVWFSKAIPKHAFILWLAIRGALVTQERLLSFGLVASMRCIFCGVAREDFDHLFFSCSFFEKIWFSLLYKCHLPLCTRDWASTISWSFQFHGSHLRHLVVRLMLAAAVYFIWRERNARMHGRPSRDVGVVIDDISFAICNRVNLLHNVDPLRINKELHQSWGFSDCIF